MARWSIAYDDLGKLEVDDDRRLYWEGERIVTDLKLSLSWWASVAVVLAGLGTFGLFVLGVGRALNLIPTSEQEISLTIERVELAAGQSPLEDQGN